MSQRKRFPPISTQDRITDLPDAILCHILSFLPTKLAVSTSILSKRWKPVWLSVTTFDMFDFFPYRVLRSVMKSRDINLPILLFRLKCKSSDYEYKISKFINSAILRGVQTLELDLVSIPLEMKYLSNIFTCNTLTVLKLTNIFIVQDLPQMNVSSIKTLHLDNVDFHLAKYMVSFFSAFPRVEELQTNQVFGILGTVFFSPPKNKIFPNLMRANISHMDLILFLRHSRSLILNIDEGPNLTFVQIPIFYNLSKLKLVFKETWRVEWKWILKLLQQSPNLQHLIIHKKRESKYGNWEDPLIVPECLTSQLKTCLFRSCRGTKCEVKFAEYVMRNSKVLHTMTIHFSSSISLNTKEEILHELSLCPKSCKLISNL